MADDSPFSGIKLSEQAGFGKLDQRLFTPQEAASNKSPQVSPQTQSATEVPDVRPASPPSPSKAAAPPQAADSVTQTKVEARFNLSDEPLYKATFVFTQEELEALEDLKLELRREFDKKVTKYDLVRAALHMLLEDHTANQSRSYATRKIKRRAG